MTSCPCKPQRLSE